MASLTRQKKKYYRVFWNFKVSAGVVPEYTIRAEIGVSSGESAYARASNNDKCRQNKRLLARGSPDLKGARVFRPWTANVSEPLHELKPRVDSDDATRQLAVLRSHFLPMDARLDAAPVRYIPAKDERVIRDST